MQKNVDQKHWEKIGKAYAVFWESKAKQEMSKFEMHFINRYLRQTESKFILDIGIGSGRIIENYLTDPAVKAIYGIDWAKSMVDYCRNKFRNDKRIKSLIAYDISRGRMPLKMEFDFISAIRVLKYNKNWQEIIGKIFSILGKKGIFIFTIPNKGALLRFTSPETAIYSTTKHEVEGVIKSFGGEILKITTFARLPDVFYDFSSNIFYVRMILLFELLLRKFFGEIFLGREFFVVVRKR